MRDNEQQQNNEPPEISPEQVESGVKAFLARAFGLEPKSNEPEPSAADARISKLETGLETVAQSVKDLVDGLTARETARAEETAREMIATIDSTLETLVREMRLTPQQSASWRETLVVDDQPSPNASAILERLRSSPSVAPDLSRALIPASTEDGEPQTVQLAEMDLATPDGISVPPQLLSPFAQAQALARADSDGDPAKYAETFRRIAFEGDSRITSPRH